MYFFQFCMCISLNSCRITNWLNGLVPQRGLAPIPLETMTYVYIVSRKWRMVRTIHKLGTNSNPRSLKGYTYQLLQCADRLTWCNRCSFAEEEAHTGIESGAQTCFPTARPKWVSYCACAHTCVEQDWYFALVRKSPKKGGWWFLKCPSHGNKFLSTSMTALETACMHVEKSHSSHTTLCQGYIILLNLTNESSFWTSDMHSRKTQCNQKENRNPKRAAVAACMPPVHALCSSTDQGCVEANVES